MLPRIAAADWTIAVTMTSTAVPAAAMASGSRSGCTRHGRPAGPMKTARFSAGPTASGRASAASSPPATATTSSGSASSTATVLA